MSYAGLLLHGRLAHTHLDALAAFLADKMPGRMGHASAVDRLTDPSHEPWWEFQSKAPAVIWPEVEQLLSRAGVGWAYVAKTDYLGSGDEETETFTAHDPTLGHGRFLFASWIAFTDPQGVERPLGLLGLAAHEITDARIAELRAWQRWLDTASFAAARTAHGSMALLAEQM